MIRRPPRSTLSSSSAASDVYKRQLSINKFFTKLAISPKKAGSQLKRPPHAKDYAIKPLRYLLRFLLHSFSPSGCRSLVKTLFNLILSHYEKHTIHPANNRFSSCSRSFPYLRD